MKLYNIKIFWLLVYATPAIVFSLGVLPPLLATALAAPLAILMPVGFGLLLCFGIWGTIPNEIGRVQAILLSFFLGTLMIVGIFVLLERYGFIKRYADVAVIVVYCGSLLGFLRVHKIFTFTDRDREVFKMVTLVALPVVLLRYLGDVTIYSDYPVIDLFQRVHFHEGALQFARFDTLNPFVANSYIPFQQVLLGVMVRNAHADPLIAEWILPVIMAPVMVAAIYVVVERLTKGRMQLVVALGLALALFRPTNPTNGSMAALATLLVLSLMLTRSVSGVSLRRRAVSVCLVVVAAVIGVFVYRLPASGTLVLLLGIAILVSLYGLKRDMSQPLILVIAVLTALAFHRAALLFMGFAVVVGATMVGYEVLHNRPRASSILTWGTIAGGAVVFMMVIRILTLQGGGGYDEFGIWWLFDYVLEPVIGKSMTAISVDSDFAMGAGGRVALFEIARALSPFCIIVIGVLFVIKFLVLRHESIPERWDTGTGRTVFENQGLQVLFASVLLLALILTGFPFVHRGAFLIVVLLSAATAWFVQPVFKCFPEMPHVSRLFIGIAPVSYIIILMMVVDFMSNSRVEPYLDRANPLLLTLLFGVTALGLFALFRGSNKVSWVLVMLLICTVIFEKTLSSAYFKPYAFFSQTPPKFGPLAHYDRVSLAMADQLSPSVDRDTVIASDPKTMVLLGARTGRPPIVSFSNLNTMSDINREKLRALLEVVKRGVSQPEICKVVREMEDSNASAEVNYLHVLKDVHSRGKDALKVLGYNNSLVPKYVGAPVPKLKTGDTKAGDTKAGDTKAGDTKAGDTKAGDTKDTSGFPLSILFVINPDTLEWLENGFTYFPTNRSFARDAQWMRGAYPTKGSLVGDAFILRLECK